MRWTALCVLLLPLYLQAAPAFQFGKTTLRWPQAEKELWGEGWQAQRIHMPWLKPDDSPTSQRILNHLYLENIGIPAPQQPGKTLQLTLHPGEGNAAEGLSSLSFQIARNDGHVLALRMEGEACGAYCEDFTLLHNFDAKTGRKLLISDLLTPRGQMVLARRFGQESQSRYVRQIARLRRSASRQDDTDERISMMSECAASLRESQPANESDSPQQLEGMDYLLSSNGLLLRRSRCSNHASRALDDVGDIEWLVPNAALVGLLTPYGQSLQGGPSADTPESPWGQILHGKLGDNVVTFWLKPASSLGSVSAVYYYDRYRKPIELNGKLENGTITLQEGSNTTLNLTVEKGSLRGEWRSGNRQLPVELNWQ